MVNTANSTSKQRTSTSNPSEDAPNCDDQASRPSTSNTLDIPELPLEGFHTLAVDSESSELRDFGLPQMEGVVKSYNINRGSGFLEVDGFNEGVFVHHSQIVMRTQGLRCLNKGEKCRFFVYRTCKGLRALQVTSVEPNGFRGPSPTSSRPVKCYNCGRKGHLSRECRLKSKDVCYVCKQPGHFSANCPKNSRNQQKNEANELKDSPAASNPKISQNSKSFPQNPLRQKVAIPSLRDVLRQMEKTQQAVPVEQKTI